MKSQIIRTYSELIQIGSYEERFEYLKLDGRVGVDTFGFDRYLNQRLYHSYEWGLIRNEVITRDLGCDLAMPGYELHGLIYIHHMNPVMVEDLVKFNPAVLDLEYLVCTSRNTHNAIHFGDASLLTLGPVERKPNDTCPWRQ